MDTIYALASVLRTSSLDAPSIATNQTFNAYKDTHSFVDTDSKTSWN